MLFSNVFNQKQHLTFCFVSSSSLLPSTWVIFFEQANMQFHLRCFFSLLRHFVASSLQLPCRSSTVFSLNHSEKVERRTWLSESQGSTGGGIHSDFNVLLIFSSQHNLRGRELLPW